MRRGDTHGSPNQKVDQASWTPSRLIIHGTFGSGRGRKMVTAATGMVVHDVAEAMVPVLIGVVIDRAVLTQDLSALLWLLGGFATLFVVLSFSWRIAARILVRIAGFGAHDLRQLAVKRVLAPRGMAGRRPPGEVLAVTTSDTRRVAEMAWVLGHQAAALAGVVTAAVALLVISLPLGLAVLIATPIVLAVMHRLARPLERRSHLEQARAAQASALATDMITGVRVLKGFGGERSAAQRYRRVSRDSLAAALRAVRSHAGFISAGEVLAGVVLAGVAVAGALLALDSRISVGEFVTVVGLAQFIHGPMNRLSSLGVETAQRRASAARVAELINEPPALPPGRVATAPDLAGGVVGHGGAAGEAGAGAGNGAGDGDRVDGSVPALQVHRLPSESGELPGFRVAAGEMVGVVIPERLTANRLVDVLGFREPAAAGDIAVGGHDLVDLGPELGRELIFAAPSDAPLFTGTVARNLVPDTGDPDDVRGDVVSATAIDDVLTHLDDGLGSWLPDQGRILSGGQRQRIALGRALHGPHPVKVLHEPTSAIDSVTEARIAAALREVTDATIVLVTQSPTLLAGCDRVIVIDQRQALIGARR